MFIFPQANGQCSLKRLKKDFFQCHLWITAEQGRRNNIFTPDQIVAFPDFSRKQVVEAVPCFSMNGCHDSPLTK